MADNKSTLRVEVVSTGIEAASRKLNTLASKAGEAEVKVARLTSNLERLMQVQGKATIAAAQHANIMSAVAMHIGAMSTSVSSASSETNRLTNSIERLTQSNETMSSSVDRSNRNLRTAVHTLTAMATAAVLYSSINLARGIVGQADAWTMMQARLKLAEGSMEGARVKQLELFDIAQKIRVPLEDMGKLYNRLAIPMQRMGKSAQETKDMVEGVSLALQLNGATAGEAASVMLQFSQAMQAGRLNGQEFNAVAENGSLIMRALEDHLGATQRELKQMASNGEITADVVNAAIAKALPKWREEFESLPVTVDSAMTRIKNAWLKAMGEMNEDTEMNKRFVQALKEVEEAIPAIRDALAEAFIFIAENIGVISTAIKGLLALKLLSWMSELATMAVTAGTRLATFVTALYAVENGAKAASAGMTILRTAASFLAGPIGAVVGVLGGMTAAYMLWGQKAPEAESKVTTATQVGVEARIRMLNQEIAKLTERNEAAGVVKAKLPELSPEMQSALSILEKLRKARAEAAEAGRPTEGLDAAIAIKQSEFERLAAMEQSYALAVKYNNERKREAALAGKIEEFYVHTATSAEKANLEVRKWKKEIEDLGGVWTPEMEKRLRAKFMTQKELNAAAKEAKEAEDALNKAIGEAERARQRHLNTLNQGIERTEEEIRQTQFQIDSVGKTATEIGNLEAARLEEQAAILHGIAIKYLDKNVDLEQYEIYKKQADKLRELAGLKRKYGETVDADRADKESKRASDKAIKDIERFLDPSKADMFGDALASAFGKGGEAIEQMAKALARYNNRQEAVLKAREALTSVTDEKQRAELLRRINEEEVRGRIDSYGDMAGAAKSFFNEQSKGYKAMEAMEKTFRAFEMAMAMESFITKSGIITSLTNLFVTSKATETAAEAASVAPHVAAEGAKQTANATTALTSALAAPFPANLAAYAVVAAMLAALGVAMGGSGGGNRDVAKERQARAGTGTVWGDEKAKSASIENSMEILAANSDIALKYTSAMLASLRNIEAGITGVTNTVLATAGLRGTRSDIEALNLKTPKNFISSLFGSSEKLLDMGIAAGNQRVQDILTIGFQGQSYAEIEKKKKFLGLTYSTKTRTNYADLDPNLENQFTLMVSDMADAVATAATAFGMSTDQAKNALNNVTLAFGEMSFMGLSGSEIEDQLMAIFSSVGDQMTQAVLGGMRLEEFRKAGEGMMETAVRVASGLEVATYELSQLGIEAISYTDVTNKKGDVATEIIRDSILLLEAGTNVGKFIKEFHGSAEELISTYRSLDDVRDSLTILGLATDVSRDLIYGAHGLDNLQSSLESFIDTMYNEEERRAFNLAKLQGEFAKLNLTVPTSREAFKSLVTHLMSTGAEGENLAGKVLMLADAFDEVLQSTVELIDTSRNDLVDAYEREADALQTTIDKFEDFSKSLREFQSSLLTGSNSPLTNRERYEEALARYNDVAQRAMAGDEGAIAQFQSVANELLNLSRAYNASGAAYTADFNRVMTEAGIIAEYADAQVDVAKASLEALNKQVEGLIDINESVLSVEQAIVKLYAAMSTTTGGVTGDSATLIRSLYDIMLNRSASEDELAHYTNLLNSGKTYEQIKNLILENDGAVHGSHANGLSYVPFDGYRAELHKGEAVLTASENRAYRMSFGQYGRKDVEPLINEIKSLREELKQLRAEQAEQANRNVAAYYDANGLAAERVVDGVEDALSKTSRESGVKVPLN